LRVPIHGVGDPPPFRPSPPPPTREKGSLHSPFSLSQPPREFSCHLSAYSLTWAVQLILTPWSPDPAGFDPKFPSVPSFFPVPHKFCLRLWGSPPRISARAPVNTDVFPAKSVDGRTTLCFSEVLLLGGVIHPKGGVPPMRFLSVGTLFPFDTSIPPPKFPRTLSLFPFPSPPLCFLFCLCFFI